MKYELTENTKTFYGKTLYQIRALEFWSANKQSIMALANNHKVK